MWVGGVFENISRNRRRRGLGWVHTLEDADGGGEVVDSPGGLEGGGEDGGGGDEIVGEGVVQVALLSEGSFGSASVGDNGRRGSRMRAGRRTWSSKTSWTPSNSFS